ncbi:MAG TPA: winged helix-turn-helix domain-containing protein [Xanthobacteraceae bacterium]|nr:winged helix-turn-helix domain-containing protein [Xanthobacteraceae bacterium]
MTGLMIVEEDSVRAPRPVAVRFGACWLDLKRWKLLGPDGTELKLAATELDLVAAFATHPGKLLSREALLRLAPAHGEDPSDRSVDTRITRLRRKLARSGVAAGDLIRTVRGGGYRYIGPAGS